MIWYLAKDKGEGLNLAWLHTKDPEWFGTFWRRRVDVVNHFVIKVQQNLPIVKNLKPGDKITVSITIEQV